MSSSDISSRSISGSISSRRSGVKCFGPIVARSEPEPLTHIASIVAPDVVGRRALGRGVAAAEVRDGAVGPSRCEARTSWPSASSGHARRRSASGPRPGRSSERRCSSAPPPGHRSVAPRSATHALDVAGLAQGARSGSRRRPARRGLRAQGVARRCCRRRAAPRGRRARRRPAGPRASASRSTSSALA